ncbi:helix-turn-helix domain-containing protein [Glutamicibacter sp. PS]|uniref:GlxA family transcriptional regulator n=1 Tax=Glutamicibacter sp. PS TaxID=3075634 RepID=UPI00284D47E2|nr:helix-turn-helix domain-containing protein [Glutamicibacter sp. PS]MDR4532698.1 helix-turn-helix domain-containing protein [Glutamicibacter sp. PS]
MSSPQSPTRVAVLALDGAYPFELGIPSRIFEAVEGLYTVSTCSIDGKPVRSAADFSIAVEHGPELLETADIVVLSAVHPEWIPGTLSLELRQALARIGTHSRIVSICTGAFILAATGLLDGRRATTHWRVAEHFRARFPQVALEPEVLFVEDGRFLSSAGAASGIDACLHVVRSDYGHDIANQVARRCVVPPFRDGGQAQFIEQPVPKPEQVGTAPARDWALSHLDEPLDLNTLARVVGMSPRTFSRRFTAEVGISPGKWLLVQRVAQAQRLLENSTLPIDRVAEAVGFATSASLRQHFHATLGVTPTAYRNTFGTPPDIDLASPALPGS